MFRFMSYLATDVGMMLVAKGEAMNFVRLIGRGGQML
jgi:hypothetical protein